MDQLRLTFIYIPSTITSGNLVRASPISLCSYLVIFSLAASNFANIVTQNLFQIITRVESVVSFRAMKAQEIYNTEKSYVAGLAELVEVRRSSQFSRAACDQFPI